MATKNLFKKLKEANSSFNNLSANRFSLLTRKELFSIAKFLRDNDRYSSGLESYSNTKTPLLASKCYSVAKSILQ